MTERHKRIPARFYRSELGNEPVRDWLKSLEKPDRSLIGMDIKIVEFGWPIGMPVCRPMGKGAVRGKNRPCWEPDSAGAVLHQPRPDGSAARVHQEIAKDSETGSRFGFGAQAPRGAGTMRQHKHIGSSLDDLLAEDGTLAEVEAAALKRVIAWQVVRGMDEKRMSKSDMARAMRTSRAALDRLLDPANESVTLRTIARAVKVLGKRLRLELA
jgi:antitoxin HicB